MAVSFSADFERWAYGIGPLHHGHHGRMDVQRGSSDRSGGIVLTMSSCLASSTFVICSNRIKNTTTRSTRTYHFKRTRRSPAPSRPSVKLWPCQFWAGCTINISEREFPTGTAGHGELLKLGIKVSQATVGRWMPWRPKVPSPTWRSFLQNHLPDIAAIDMFVVVTATFRLPFTSTSPKIPRKTGFPAR